MRFPLRFPLNRQAFLNFLGLVVLLGGISASVFIHCQGENPPMDQVASDGESDRDGTLSLQDSKRLSGDIERTWGKLGTMSFSHWTEGLRHPQQVSILILTGSLLVAFGCFFVADA